MKIAVGADHAGYALKERLLEKLKSEGHEVADFGTHSTESTDYPDYAAAVGRAVVKGDAEMGLLVCSSGVGMSIAANKIRGIRAADGHLRRVAFAIMRAIKGLKETAAPDSTPAALKTPQRVGG